MLAVPRARRAEIWGPAQARLRVVLARPILFRAGPCFWLLFSGHARADPKSPTHIPSTTHTYHLRCLRYFQHHQRFHILFQTPLSKRHNMYISILHDHIYGLLSSLLRIPYYPDSPICPIHMKSEVGKQILAGNRQKSFPFFRWLFVRDDCHESKSNAIN
jgi:hypothetical protein